jgi:hypothetical protein
MSSIIYLALTPSDDSIDTTTDNSEPEQAAAIVGPIRRAQKLGCKKQAQITSPTPSQSPGPKSLDPDALFISETMEVLDISGSDSKPLLGQPSTSGMYIRTPSLITLPFSKCIKPNVKPTDLSCSLPDRWNPSYSSLFDNSF